MDIWKAIRTIGRRWYISLIVLNLCAAATASLVASAEATYESGATMILLPPNVSTDPPRAADGSLIPDNSPVNPFLVSGIPMAQAVASASNSDRVADQLKAAGLDNVAFIVTNVEGSPILTMTVDSDSSTATNLGIGVVLNTVRTITRDLQAEANAPEAKFITAHVLAPPPGSPAESLAAKTKIAMGMVVASFLVVVCAALLFDNLAVRLARRRQRRGEHLLVDEVDHGDMDRAVDAHGVVVAPRRDEADAARTVGAGADRDDALVRLKATAGR